MSNNGESLANSGKTRESQRISPDITCITFHSQSSGDSGSSQNLNSSQPISSPIFNGDNMDSKEHLVNLSMNQNPHTIVHLNPISEVPPGQYEYVFGDNGEVRILCRICQYVSNKKSNFKRHFTNMHFVHEEDCKYLECCGIRFSTKGEKFHHTKTVHKSGYKCTICLKVFDRPALLQRHLAKHTGKKPYKCSLCTYQTPNKANAKRHIEKRHSDVQEGSILFVTDDGEQIKMEVVSKSDKESSSGKEGSSPGSSSIPITMRRVIKTSADSSCSFSSINGNISPFSFLKLPRSPPSATVTSSSISPPGYPIGPMVNETYEAMSSLKESEDKKPQIAHSIEKIIESPNPNLVQDHALIRNKATSAPYPALFSTPQTKGNPASSSSHINPENGTTAAPSSFIPLIGNNHNSINELNWKPHCSPDWSQTSSPFPFSAYALRKPQPYFHQYQHPQNMFNPPPPGAATISSSAPAIQSHQGFFHQCIHGCWHHIQANQMTSLNSFPAPAQYLFMNSSPDLRSSSSFSLNTENSSIMNLAKGEEDEEEEDDDSDCINVVGDSSEDEGASSTSKKLTSICEGLGSFSTAEISTKTKAQEQKTGPEGGTEKRFDSGPPVDHSSSLVVRSRRISYEGENFERNNNHAIATNSVKGNDDTNTDEHDSIAATSQYIPKKLRVSKAYLK